MNIIAFVLTLLLALFLRLFRLSENPVSFGKYEFREIRDRDLANTQEVYRVQDAKRTWYRVYSSRDRVLFIRQEPSNSQI
jgi:hypothetical protein